MTTQESNLRSPQEFHIVGKLGVQIFGRVEDWAGSLLTQAGVTGITYRVVDLNNNCEKTGSGNLTVANVIFDTPQTGGGWPYPDAPYNFRAVLPAADFPVGGHKYWVVAIVDPVTGEDFPIGPYWIPAHPLLGD